MRRTGTVVLALLLIAVFLAGSAGCGSKEDESGGTQDEQESGGAEAATSQQGVAEDAYLQGRIKIVLNTDLLWGDVRNGAASQGEVLQAATGKIYDLAASHGCTVEEYEFYGPYEGAVAVFALPEGKDEEEAITEFLSEPLVSSAFRIEASD